MWWEEEWLLKNSLIRNLKKLDRVRKLYKRFFSVSWTFSIIQISTFFEEPSFSTATGFINIRTNHLQTYFPITAVTRIAADTVFG